MDKQPMHTEKERLYCLHDLEGSVIHLIRSLEEVYEEARAKGASEESIRIVEEERPRYYDQGYDTLYYVTYERPETEKEQASREKREARIKAKQEVDRAKAKERKEAAEKKELERLKKKFEKEHS